MPRGPRRDAPGVWHHTMLGGIERLVRRASDLARALNQTCGNVSLAAKWGENAVRSWSGMIDAWCR